MGGAPSPSPHRQRIDHLHSASDGPNGHYQGVCLTVYLGSQDELPAIDWSKTDPSFNVRPLRRNRAVRRRLQMPHLYEIGAYTGCGCGFLGEEDDEDEAVARRVSRAALRRYVEDAASTGRVELLVCWIGDEALPANASVVSPGELEEADFGGAWDHPLRFTIGP